MNGLEAESWLLEVFGAQYLSSFFFIKFPASIIPLPSF